MTTKTAIVIASIVAAGFLADAQDQTPAAPRPVRNAGAQLARELLVLRHHQLRKGGHEEFYRLSAENVWPWLPSAGAFL